MVKGLFVGMSRANQVTTRDVVGTLEIVVIEGDDPLRGQQAARLIQRDSKTADLTDNAKLVINDKSHDILL